MYVVTVEFVIAPEHQAEFMREMVANATASREREPGCRQFDVCVAPEQPATVFLYEIYDDRLAFDAHVATTHFRAFDATTKPWVLRKTARVYEGLDPAGLRASRSRRCGGGQVLSRTTSRKPTSPDTNARDVC